MSIKTMNLFTKKTIPSVQIKKTKRIDALEAHRAKYREYTKDMTAEEKDSFSRNLSANGDTFESFLKGKALRLERKKEREKNYTRCKLCNEEKKRINVKDDMCGECAPVGKNNERIILEKYECPNCSHGKFKITCFDCFGGEKFKPDPNEMLTFGKYKGLTSHDAFTRDEKYCEWIYKNVDKCPRYLKYVFNKRV